jgi:hypothetical protein
MSSFEPYKASISIRASIGLVNTYLTINDRKLRASVDTLFSKQSDLRHENEELKTLIRAYDTLLSKQSDLRRENEELKTLIRAYQQTRYCDSVCSCTMPDGMSGLVSVNQSLHGIRLCPADSADTIRDSSPESSSSVTRKP